MNLRFVSIGSFALALSLTAAARSFDASPVPAPAQSDRSSVGAIVAAAVTDVKLCDFALEKTSNADVRSLCRSESVENSRIAEQGLGIAARLGAADVTLEPLPQTDAMLESLAHFSGRDFDRRFLLNAIALDGNTAHVLRFSIEFTTDLALKRYENAVLPVVLRHLDGSETLLRRLSELP